MLNLKINPEVLEALKEGKPVVALESTIISHGMPYPQNVETALAVEAEIRAKGVIPATIGIIEGTPVIGMTPDEIEEFGKRKNITKVSRRDLAAVHAASLWGATTVAATMILANLAHIKVFVTGGIGGVHKGAETNFDISADLEELGMTPIAVVCSGPKAILDIPLTLEYLETKGVPILGYQTSSLAAFYSVTSGYNVDYKMDSALDIARLIKSQDEFNLKTGILIANPVPQESEIKNEEITEIIDEALARAHEEKIVGKNITPFLLKTIAELTAGRSLKANIALIKNNARVGALIAIEYSKLN